MSLHHQHTENEHQSTKWYMMMVHTYIHILHISIYTHYVPVNRFFGLHMGQLFFSLEAFKQHFKATGAAREERDRRAVGAGVACWVSWRSKLNMNTQEIGSFLPPRYHVIFVNHRCPDDLRQTEDFAGWLPMFCLNCLLTNLVNVKPKKHLPIVFQTS